MISDKNTAKDAEEKFREIAEGIINFYLKNILFQ